MSLSARRVTEDSRSRRGGRWAVVPSRLPPLSPLLSSLLLSTTNCICVCSDGWFGWRSCRVCLRCWWWRLKLLLFFLFVCCYRGWGGKVVASSLWGDGLHGGGGGGGRDPNFNHFTGFTHSRRRGLYPLLPPSSVLLFSPSSSSSFSSLSHWLDESSAASFSRVAGFSLGVFGGFVLGGGGGIFVLCMFLF